MSTADHSEDVTDIFVIGGGVSGCGIARDAAGRGLSVALAEMGDLAQATSSSSTKLFHGGLRYLEYFEFRLVREALKEREVLLRAMPHISWPQRFVLPYHPQMRFESETPTSRLLNTVIPWTKGRRPAWLIRLGLFLYDHLGGRKILEGTRTLDLSRDPAGAPLKAGFARAFEYSDCWVEDSRLVVLNARDAELRGATILTRTKVVECAREDGLWRIELEDTETRRRHMCRARVLVNASGPWVGQVIRDVAKIDSSEGVRLVRGSHVVTRRLFDHDRAYFFQGSDGRIIFAIPYERDFTLIGTTDVEHTDPAEPAVCTDAEMDYLLDFASQYFAQPVTREEVIWTYSGVRPLYDDGAKSATAATRDYVLSLDEGAGAPLLNVFGGKITTYRRLSEAALETIRQHFPGMPGAWTAGVPLPGGNFPVNGFEDMVKQVQDALPALAPEQARRLARAYGTDALEMLSAEDAPGRDFGAGLTECELGWLMRHEYARTAEDVVWRRSKLGLRLNAGQVSEIDAWMDACRRERVDTAAAQ